MGVVGDAGEVGLGEGSFGMLIGVMFTVRRILGERGDTLMVASASISVAVVELRREDGGRKPTPDEAVADLGRPIRSGLVCSPSTDPLRWVHSVGLPENQSYV